jgi:DNA-binding MarR family transcriptional regulator
MRPTDDPCWQVATECTGATLRRAAREVSTVFDRALAPTAIRSTQFSLLVAVHLAGEMSLSALASRLGLDRTTLTRNFKPLLRDGLLRQVKDPDRRFRRLTLTAAGERMVQRALPLWEQAQRSVIERLGQARWANLIRELKAMEAVVA